MSFPTPTWAGTATISGRTITRTGGDLFTDGFPSAGLYFLFDPTVIDGIVTIPPTFIDDHGHAFYMFATWFIDSNHLGLMIDATYDLLIPSGTPGQYAPAIDFGGHSRAAFKWPSFNRAVCWADGTHVTSDPQTTLPSEWAAIHTANPLTVFGGDAFNSATSNLGGHPQVYIRGITYTVASVGSSTDITLTEPTGGVVQVDWQQWNVPPPPSGSPDVEAVSIWALPAGSAGASLRYLAARECGFMAYSTDQWQFYAQVRGNSTIDTSVAWSCSLGTINATTGAWTAPSSVTGYQGVVVTATSNEDGSTIGQIFFQVSPQTARTVDINPAAYSPPTGWKLDGGPGGAIPGGLVRTLIIPA